MSPLPGWLSYSAQHRKDPLLHARPNPATTPGVSRYFDVTAACGQGARIPQPNGRAGLFDPEAPRACPKCSRATRAQPWPLWRTSAYLGLHDAEYAAVVAAAVRTLIWMLGRIPNPNPNPEETR